MPIINHQTLELVSAPAAEPVSLDEAKAHLKVDHADEDSYISDLIVLAREMAENITHLSLITQTWVYRLSDWPRMMADLDQQDILHQIEMPRPPLQTLVTLEYLDDAGVMQILDAAKYDVDTNARPATVKPAWGVRWPTIRGGQYGAVTITMVTGYGVAGSAVPMGISKAMHSMLATFYKQREDITHLRVNDVPQVAMRALLPYRVRVVASP